MFSDELDAYVNSIVKRICKKHGLKYSDVLQCVFANAESSTTTKKKVNLELINLNNTNYLYDFVSKKVYSYDVNPQLLGVLDEEMNIVKLKQTINC